MTPRRRRLLAVVFVLGAAAMAIALLALRAGEWLRAEIERRLQERLVPVVSLTGPLSFSVLPRPTLVLRGLSLTDAGERLLSIDRLALEVDTGGTSADALALAALRIDGVSARLVRGADGRWNAAAWLRPAPAESGTGLPLLLEEVVVSDAGLSIEDGVHGARADFSGLHLRAGPFAPGRTAAASIEGSLTVAGPTEAVGEFRVAGRATAEAAGWVVHGIEAQLAGMRGEWALRSAEFGAARVVLTPAYEGRAEDVRAALRADGPLGPANLRLALAVATASDAGGHGEGLVLSFDATSGDKAVDGTLMAPAVTLEGSRWRVPGGELALAATLADGRRHGARLPFDAQGEGGAGEVSFRSALVSLARQDGGARELRAEGSLSFAAGAAQGELSGAFDDSRFSASWRHRTQAALPLELALTVDRIDADRYLPSQAADAEPPVLDAWAKWPVRAEATIGILRYRGFDARNVRLQLNGGEEQEPPRESR